MFWFVLYWQTSPPDGLPVPALPLLEMMRMCPPLAYVCP